MARVIQKRPKRRLRNASSFPLTPYEESRSGVSCRYSAKIGETRFRSAEEPYRSCSKTAKQQNSPALLPRSSETMDNEPRGCRLGEAKTIPSERRKVEIYHYGSPRIGQFARMLIYAPVLHSTPEILNQLLFFGTSSLYVTLSVAGAANATATAAAGMSWVRTRCKSRTSKRAWRLRSPLHDRIYAEKQYQRVHVRNVTLVNCFISTTMHLVNCLLYTCNRNCLYTGLTCV